MGSRVNNLIGRASDRRYQRRLARLADSVGALDFSELRLARGHAGLLRSEIDRLCRAADSRIAELDPEGAVIDAPAESDWRWRPEFWRRSVSPPGVAAVASGSRFGEGLAIFHDCTVSELTLRQLRNNATRAFAPFGLSMDVFGFDGSFLSLALDLPTEAVLGLTRRHLVGLGLRVRMERPLEVFARLNIRHGPNTAQLVREIPGGSEELTVEFDLAYCDLNERRIEKAWIDLIVDRPAMNLVEILDLTLYRRPRAEI